MTNHQLSKYVVGCNVLDVTVSGLDNHIKDLNKRIKSQQRRLNKTSCIDTEYMLKESVYTLTKCLNIVKEL